MAETTATIDRIREAINDGYTVTIATALRAWPVDAKTLQRFEAAGFPLFKADADGRTLMATRNRAGRPVYDCIDGCRITASR